MTRVLFGYYSTYVKREKGKDNIYGIAGSNIHSVVEEICNGYEVNPQKELETILSNCEMLGVYFPTEAIKDKWVKNMRAFVANFSKPKWFDRAESEIQFLYQLDNINIQRLYRYS